MDGLTLFGLAAISLMLLAYMMERRSRHFILLFAVGCALSGIYGFLQGAWPFAVVETIWAGVALHRYWRQEA